MKFNKSFFYDFDLILVLIDFETMQGRELESHGNKTMQGSELDSHGNSIGILSALGAGCAACLLFGTIFCIVMSKKKRGLDSRNGNATWISMDSISY